MKPRHLMWRLHVAFALFLCAFSWLCLASAFAADTTPFFRMRDPHFLSATTAPKQYVIEQPTGSTSYRLVNPCSVDIRIKTVSSMVESVGPTIGTRFLARTAEVLASSPPFMTTRTVSVMTVADPGPAGCTVELQYGTGQ
jgi:hypothetical protein